MKQYDLLRWKEFDQKDAPSITILFSSKPYPEQEKIAQILEKGNVTLIKAAYEKDALTGGIIHPAHLGCLMSDGDMVWDGSLPYYIRKYNLRLPSAIEEKILTTY